MPDPELKCRVHLGMVTSSTEDAYWELRIMRAKGPIPIARVRLTTDQFSEMMSGAMVVDAPLEVLGDCYACGGTGIGTPCTDCGGSGAEVEEPDNG